eukprot:5617112-Amphidinium_carterae.2
MEIKTTFKSESSSTSLTTIPNISTTSVSSRRDIVKIWCTVCTDPICSSHATVHQQIIQPLSSGSPIVRTHVVCRRCWENDVVQMAQELGPATLLSSLAVTDLLAVLDFDLPRPKDVTAQKDSGSIPCT